MGITSQKGIIKIYSSYFEEESRFVTVAEHPRTFDLTLPKDIVFFYLFLCQVHEQAYSLAADLAKWEPPEESTLKDSLWRSPDRDKSKKRARTGADANQPGIVVDNGNITDVACLSDIEDCDWNSSLQSWEQEAALGGEIARRISGEGQEWRFDTLADYTM